MGDESLWNKAIDKLETGEVKLAGYMGGPKAAEDMKIAVEDLRHGHLIQVVKDGLKVDRDVAVNALHKAEGLNVYLAGKMGGPAGAGHEKQAMDDLNHGRLLSDAGNQFNLMRDTVAHVTGHHAPLETPKNQTVGPQGKTPPHSC